LEYSTSTMEDKNFESVDLQVIVEEIKENINRLIVENKAEIQFKNLPTIYGSNVRLYQLFQNLITNSIKFKREGVDPIIKIESKTLTSGLEISVTDNGIGIEQQHLENVFNLFTKLNTLSRNSGSGIGLATCKKITKEMGGNIHIESEFGKGTAVLIFLPKKSESCERN